MAVSSIGCANLSSSRVLSVFLALCIVFLTKDYWLPQSGVQSWSTRPSTTTETPILGQSAIEKVPTPSVSEVVLVDTIMTTATVTVTHTPATPTPSHLNDDECSTAPRSDNVMVIMKTGASELEYKLPTHLITLLKCIPKGHFQIYSDLEQTYADYPVYDAIQNVSAEWREKHEDFALYRQLKQYSQDSTDFSKLKGDKSWNLDKWKFMPMMYNVFDSSPGEIEWFVYIEADTSLSWLNLLQWLKTMNPKEELYLGSQNVLGDTSFAHGGSGYVVSRGAAEKLKDVRDKAGTQEFDKKWEEITSNTCCGDAIVAQILYEECNIPLVGAWPVLQGEKITTVDYTERHWCTPPVTLHHVSPVEVDSMWRFQTAWVQKHGWHKPYMWKDVFEAFVAEHISQNRTAWNNISDRKKIVAESHANDDERKEDWFVSEAKMKEYERKSTESFDGCAEACIVHVEECVQWQFEPGRCYLGYDARLGAADDRDSVQWESGWNEARIKSLIAEREPCELKWNE